MSTASPNAWAEAIAWPIDRVGEAMASLAGISGLSTRAAEVPRLAPPESGRRAWLEDAMAQFAAWLGVDAEHVGASFADVDEMVRGAPPALVCIGSEDEPMILALTRTTARTATFLAPDGALHDRPLAWLQQALVPRVVQERASEVDAMLARVGLDDSRRARTRATLLRQRFAQARVQGIWTLQAPVSAPFFEQLRRADIPSRFVALVAMQCVQTALFALSWWALGVGALSGHIDRGWLIAWALMLATIVPIRAAALRVEGTLATDAALVLKRRLLAGALAMEPDETRADGAGRMLSRALESQAVGQLALDAGGVLLLSAVDLVVAAIVLALGASAWLQLPLFALFVAIAIGLIRALLDRRAAWTAARLGLTHDMTERLVGHRTRVAQEHASAWHDAEDEAVSRAVDAERRLDRVGVALAVFPRAWMIASIAGLSEALVRGAHEPGAIAITIGGTLLAFRAFRRVGAGAASVTGAIVAARAVKPLFDAGARVERAPSPRVVAQRENRARASSAPLVEARNLAFRYPGRHDDVFSNVSLTLAHSEQVLLVGPSGAGKSTLGALLSGLRQPTSGLLLLDGMDRATIGGDRWRKHIASAPQFHDNHVLGATFAFNVLMGRAWPPSEEDLVEAETVCRELELGELLDRMPAGLMQTVGETGWQLSHGERSRLTSRAHCCSAPTSSFWTRRSPRSTPQPSRKRSIARAGALARWWSSLTRRCGG